jgi:hypothetical protein
VRSSPTHTPGRNPVASSLARVRASSRSVLTLAQAMTRTAVGLATTTRRTYGSRIRATAKAPPVASKATSSSVPKLWAKASRSCGAVADLGPDRKEPSSNTATFDGVGDQAGASQKSLWTSRPMNRACPPF